MVFGINDLEDKLNQLFSELIVGFNHLEKLKITLINSDTQVFPIVKEFHMDLDSVPEDERITATIVMNLPSEICNFYNTGMHTSEYFINRVTSRKDDGKLQQCYNEFYFRSQEIIAETKPLFMKTHPNEFPNMLSLPTGFISPIWYDPISLQIEELTLNISSKNYSLPNVIKQMTQLKVLSITNHSDYPSNLHNLSLIQCLSNLKKIKFEHVLVSSIEPIFALKNLEELSFVMCEINDALMSYTTESSSYVLPNLTNLEIDMCYDLKQLPSKLCNLVNLQKLTITNCHELHVLPEVFRNLSKLEILNLHCCTKLQELPESITNLHNLSFVDLSDCLSISKLPEEIGELCGIKVLKMNGCGGLQELPMSVSELQQLEEVICDEETSYLWMEFESDLHNLKIHVVEDDRLGCFMKIVQ